MSEKAASPAVTPLRFTYRLLALFGLGLVAAWAAQRDWLRAAETLCVMVAVVLQPHVHVSNPSPRLQRASLAAWLLALGLGLWMFVTHHPYASGS